MTKIDALLRTLDALVNANKSGYRCSSEIDTVIKALLDELKAPADIYVRPLTGGEVRVELKEEGETPSVGEVFSQEVAKMRLINDYKMPEDITELCVADFSKTEMSAILSFLDRYSVSIANPWRVSE